MRELYLDNRNHAVTISDETYAQIMTIVNQGQVCQECQNVYTEEKPQVSLNTCLACFLRKKTNQGLSYAGVHTSQSGYTYHRFLDEKGYIHTTSTSSTSSDRDEFMTLQYWGFMLPDSIDRYRVSIYGDVKTNEAVIVESQPYNQKDTAFLVYKNDAALELNKRKGEIRKRFADAKARIEATKDTKGGYHLAGYNYTVYQVYDSTLYPFIVEAENAKLQATK
jgi:hypothetical protein